jgi:DNA polymerase III alpha subunit
MKINKFGEMVLDEQDLCDAVMKGTPIWQIKNCVVDRTVDLEKTISTVKNPEALMTWTFPDSSDIPVHEFDFKNQSNWFMPQEYKSMDIAEYVLDLCTTEQQLQRVGKELLMFQERGLFDLLKYFKYLVDVMTQNHVIWGVGRGSSVSSYVLYLLKVHRIDSLYYDLDPAEFLR